ncbi:MAG: Lrp/AsnC family transcriptional regulator [Clostridia bacterium]|nr:Lrp/AsnC family transcriptional regulator [Clostridia bacterium]
MKKLLKAIEEDSRLESDQLGVMFDMTAKEIDDMIRQYEKDGVILGYTALIDWDKTDLEYVSAMIELNVEPRRDTGFDEIAEKIYSFDEVKSVYLMSGGFDLLVMIEGRTMREVAYFVARKLASMKDVTATATHFVLRKYKDKGVVFGPPQKDERGNII